MSQALMDALKSITEKDYNELLDKITAAEAELQSLRELQKIIAAKLGKAVPGQRGGARTRKASTSDETADGEPDTPSQPTGGPKIDQYRKAVREYLMANGPAISGELCRKTGIPNGSITAVMHHPMFVKTALGWGLKENHK